MSTYNNKSLLDKSLNRQQPAETRSTENLGRSNKKAASRFIRRTKFDEEARLDLARIKDMEEDCVRPAIKIPASKDLDIRTICKMKRQTFQEFALALVLQEMDRLQRRGEYVPVHRQAIIDEE